MKTLCTVSWGICLSLFLITGVAKPVCSWASAKTYGGLIIGVPGEDLGTGIISQEGAINVLHGSSSGITTSEKQFWSQYSNGILGDPEVNDHFGSSLVTGDFNGDGTTDLAIGVPLEDVGSIWNAGAVNILYGSGSIFTAAGNQLWTQFSPDIQGTAEADDQFGYALAAGDFNGDNRTDLVIGVPFEDVIGNDNAGAVNIIYGSSHGLTSTGNQLLLHSSSSDGIEPHDHFGYAVAAGNFNGDSYCDLAVGVPGEDFGVAGTPAWEGGAISIWYGSATGLSPPAGGLQVIHRGWPSNPGAIGLTDAFGSALAVGNFNGDNLEDLAIGLPGAVYGAANGVGEVMVFYGSAGGFPASSPAPELWRQNLLSGSQFPQPDDHFGAALAAGDINGDGADDLAIGVPGESFVFADNAGSVDLLYGSSTGLASINANEFNQGLAAVQGAAEDDDSFGAPLAIGDVNGDGYADLAVGVPNESFGTAADYAGAVNLFYGSTSGLTTTGNQLVGQHWPSIPDSAEYWDRFGAALAIFPHPPLENPLCFPIKAKNGNIAVICF